MKRILSSYYFIIFLGFFFLSLISEARGQDSIPTKRDTVKADFVSRMESFFQESSKKSLIDFGTRSSDY